MRWKTLNLSCLALAVAVTAGCRSPQRTDSPTSTLAFANESKEAVLDVQVVADSNTVYRLGAVAARAVTSDQRLPGGVPQVVEVQWRTADGRALRYEVRRAPTAPTAGRMVLQLEADETVRPFVVALRAGPGGDIPWARPESWEGTVGIPGLNAGD